VWVYDRAEKRKFCTNVANIAHETKLYSNDLESKLATEIEAPANEVLDKIRSRQSIDRNDKTVLAKYLIALWKRVPKAKERIKGAMPRVAGEIGERIYREIDRLTSERPDLRELGEKRKAEVSAILKRHLEAPPDFVFHHGVDPDKAPHVLDTITAMIWRFWITGTGTSYLTSDNPVFFFESEGVGKPSSELCFPISSDIMLWATWRTDLLEGYLPARGALVKEFNRRTVQNSKRFVFAQTDERWILPFVLKTSLRLNRIR